jgi:hypothetical protein
MELWMVVTVAAAFMQNVRSTLQKHLQTMMGTTGATFARFGFGWPFAWVCLAVLARGFGFEVPVPTASFLLWVTVAALAQIAVL